MDNLKDKLLYEDELTEESFYPKDRDFYSEDNDFYPPEDNRIFHIYSGQEFEEYAKYIYDLYEEEGFYEN